MLPGYKFSELHALTLATRFYVFLVFSMCANVCTSKFEKTEDILRV